LRFAIEGESDERIADLLQIAPRTLKKSLVAARAVIAEPKFACMSYAISERIPRNCTLIRVEKVRVGCKRRSIRATFPR
jgi:hypothetical protein